MFSRGTPPICWGLGLIIWVYLSLELAVVQQGVFPALISAVSSSMRWLCVSLFMNSSFGAPIKMLQVVWEKIGDQGSCFNIASPSGSPMGNRATKDC